MRLYLDDDSVDRRLVGLLGQAGHDVFVPPEAGRRTVEDHVHFLNAIGDDRAILTQNDHDFRGLHELVVKSGGHHPGLLIVRKDNDGRDMKPHEIERAIARLVASLAPIADECHVLNAFRRR